MVSQTALKQIARKAALRAVTKQTHAMKASFEDQKEDFLSILDEMDEAIGKALQGAEALQRSFDDVWSAIGSSPANFEAYFTDHLAELQSNSNRYNTSINSIRESVENANEEGYDDEEEFDD